MTQEEFTDMKATTFVNNRYLLLLLGLITFASLACSLPQAILKAEPTSLPISSEAITEMQDNIGDAAKAFEETGQVNLQITEVQITSYLVNELSKQENPFVQNPQILLREGEIQMTADYQQGELVLPLKAAISVKADGAGNLAYELTSASIGPLALPQALIDTMLGQFQQMFDNNLSSQLDRVFIETISIADGTMTIQGRSR
jgi:uncharacterized protein YpmS